jgi:fibronectin type 3 domain-containing protein
VTVADLPKGILTYTDPATAGETVWYFLTAVDTGGNESELSSGLDVKHADRTPLSLKGLTVTATEAGIMISLNPAAPDFGSLTIQRRRPDQSVFKTIAASHPMADFLDKYVNRRTHYVYRIIAYDRSGNVTTSPDMTVTSK